MPFDRSTDLDLALMESSDQCLRNLPPTTSIPSFHTEIGSEDIEDLPLAPTFASGSNTGIESNASIPLPVIHTLTSSDKMQVTGRIVAKRLHLNAESKAELDQFCAVSNGTLNPLTQTCIHHSNCCRHHPKLTT
jgi:hypothetical protein